MRIQNPNANKPGQLYQCTCGSTDFCYPYNTYYTDASITQIHEWLCSRCTACNAEIRIAHIKKIRDLDTNQAKDDRIFTLHDLTKFLDTYRQG